MKTYETRQMGVEGEWETGGFIELEKEDSELVCSAFSLTTTSSILLVKSGSLPTSSLSWLAHSMLPEHMP